MVKLPTKKNEVHLDPASSCVFLYGPPKVGKTSLTAEIKDAFFLGTEKRHKQFNIFVEYPANWGEFREYVEALEANCPYPTIVIDTIGDLYRMCEAWVCKELGIEHPGDLGFGKGWSACEKEFKEWLSRLTFLDGIGVWFIGHAKKVDTKTSIKELTTVEPDVPSTGRKVVRALADQILFMGVDTYKRKKVNKNTGEETTEYYQEPTMLAAPTEDIEAGDSFSILPPRFRLGKSGKEAYEIYLSYFKETNKTKSTKGNSK